MLLVWNTPPPISYRQLYEDLITFEPYLEQGEDDLLALWWTFILLGEQKVERD